MPGLTKDAFVRGYTFDGATGLHSGEQLEDLVTRASPADGSELVDQSSLETYLDEILSIYRLRVKAGGITHAMLADGAVGNNNLAEGFTMIKSVQRGTVTVAANPSYPSGSVTTDVAITAVDPAKAFLIYNTNGGDYVIGILNSATQVRFTNGNSVAYTAAWQVVEFI